ncbi:MAG: hypothetical protein H0V29_11035, partial [Thermoleophilaceae bacterium]|nr:hypothetical protein [Thermoleophilaceae bacterium]
MALSPPSKSIAPASVVSFLIGLAATLTAFWDGMFGISRWGPVTLAVLLVLVALAFLRPIAPRGPAALALGGLTGLWLVSVLSTGWADSPGQAKAEAGRWLLYAAFLAALLPLLRARAQALGLIAGVAAGCLTVAGYQLIRFLAGTGDGLFLGDRLDGPIGYANAQADLMALGLWPLFALAERGGSRLLRALGLGGAAALLSVALLSGTRAVLPILAIVGIALVALLPGRVRRAWLLLGLAVSVA